MAARTDRIALYANGFTYTGWTEVSVTRSIEEAASSFVLSVSDKPATGKAPTLLGDKGRRMLLRPMTPVAIAVEAVDSPAGFRPLLEGNCYTTQGGYSSQSHEVAVSGRSKTAQIVDCTVDWPEPVISGSTVLRIAQLLCVPYNVNVTSDVDVGAPLPTYKVDRTETVFEAIERACRLRGLLITDDTEGGLQLTRVGTARHNVRLTRGGQILSGSGTFDASGLYSTYRVLAQRPGNNSDFGAVVAQVEAEALDDTITGRLLTIAAEQSADTARAKVRATWEAATRAGRASSFEYTVAGWRDIPGDDSADLWTPGRLVRVVDDWLDVDADLLIVAANFSLDNGGTVTTLTLAPPAGYELLAPADRVKVKKSSKAKAQNGIGVWKELENGVPNA